MRWGLVLLIAVGCRQVFGLEGPARAIDAAIDEDAPIDMGVGPPLTCIERWQQGQVSFGPATAVVPASSGASDTDPFTANGELELYFSRNAQLVVSQRNAVSEPFLVAAGSSLDSAANDSKVTVRGNIAYLASNRAGGTGGADIWHALRSSPTEPFVVDQMFVNALNTGADELDPHLSLDSTRMYLAPRAPGGNQTIAVSTRTAIGTDWGVPVAVSELDGAGNEGDPSLTDDELVIVFSSTGTGGGDLYYATRASAQVAFDPPLALTALNTSIREGGPHITGDGCTLYFESMASGNLDIYVVELD